MPSDKKIRILFLIDELAVGGTERQLLWLVEALPEERFQPIIGVLRETEFSRALRIKAPIVNFKWAGLPLVKNVVLVDTIRKYLLQERIDILQTQFVEAEIYGSLAARLTHPRPIVVATRRNLYHWIADDPLRFRVARYLLKGAQLVLANSYSAKAQCLRLEGLPAEKVRVIANAVAVEKFIGLTQAEARARCGLAPDGVLIGVVGNWRPVKGMDVFLRAARQVLAALPEASFLLVGSGPQEGELRQLAEALGLAGKVRFWGPSQEAHVVMSAFDIAVQPSRSESFSNVLVEYMAAARPIVATRVGDAETILDNGRCGMLVAPDAPEAMAQGIIDLHRRREQGAAMALRARQRVLDNWTPTAIVGQYVESYARLCPLA